MTKDILVDLLEQMTLEEKASLCSGADFWHTKAIERLGVPSVMVSDGPHGLRQQKQEGDHLGVNDSIVAVCFPAGCASASSFDRDLLGKMGKALGESCQAEGVSTILGPGVNIKRSPLCGRNFEYFSEDPYLAGEMASSVIKGVQSKNVGTSIKHFACNSQETRRMSSDSVVDERTLREIYLYAFEKAIKDAHPWTVMCSYNVLNGKLVSENKKLLNDILRDEWGYEGLVVSDWGAVGDRVEGIKAGLDLEMPDSRGINDARIVEAVKDGRLSEQQVDACALRVMELAFKYAQNRDEAAVFDREEQHRLSEKIAEGSMVLLKNDGVLPLSEDKKVAFIGKYAKKPRYQGGGSSHINSYKVSGALEFATDNVTFAMGFDDKKDEIDEALVKEAINVAADSDVAVIFAGLPDSFESEGYDRTHMNLPECQNSLIREILKVQKNVVIVLHNGSPVEMPWVNEVSAVLESYLGGEAVGEAQYNILYGKVNPSGKLAETFPLRLEDNPSFLSYIGEGNRVEYREGIFVGYRYYDKKKMDVLFPFGHGLSYTTFEYSNLRMDKNSMDADDNLVITVDVKNTGAVIGKEVVQLYVSDPDSTVIKAPKELKGFEKIELSPGETKTVAFTLSRRDFAYYEVKENRFRVESGAYDILVGSSSRDIRAKATVDVKGDRPRKTIIDLNTIFLDIQDNPKLAPFVKELYEASTMAAACDTNATTAEAGDTAVSKAMQDAMMAFMPLRAMLSFQDGSVTYEKLLDIIRKMNEA